MSNLHKSEEAIGVIRPGKHYKEEEELKDEELGSDKEED